jgi:hypothetical protein
VISGLKDTVSNPLLAAKCVLRLLGDSGFFCSSKLGNEEAAAAMGGDGNFATSYASNRSACAEGSNWSWIPVITVVRMSECSLSGIYNLAPFAAADSINSFKKDKFLSTCKQLQNKSASLTPFDKEDKIQLNFRKSQF